MNAGKRFGVLLALLAGVAGWELLTAPSPRLTLNRRGTDGMFDQLMPGMTEGQIETLLGLPHTVEGGQIVRVQETDAPEEAFEIQSKRRNVGDDILNTYEGLDHERIRVLFSARDHHALVVEYCVDEEPVLYKGPAGERNKLYSAMSVDRVVPENPEQREHARRIVVRRAQRGIPEMIVASGPTASFVLVRRIGCVAAGAPPPPPATVPCLAPSRRGGGAKGRLDRSARPRYSTPPAVDWRVRVPAAERFPSGRKGSHELL